jgi:signal transduction histidine kinase
MSAFRSPEAAPRKASFERRLASVVAASLIAGGILWVFVTDVLLYAFVTDVGLIARIETAKGWVFVGIAALLVYLTTRWMARRMMRARAALSTVVDSIADGVLLLGPDRRIEYANPAVRRMLRWDALVGMGAEEFSRRFHVSYPDGFIVPPDQYLSQRAFDEGGPLHYKALLHLPGSQELVISATAAAVRDEVDEQPHLVVSVMHDITATERMEQTRNEFFAAAAHALKTPVAIIKTSVQNAVADAAQFRVSLAAIERQCNNIDRLAQNLFILARTRTRTLTLRQERIDLKPAIERNLRDVAIECARHQIVKELTDHCRVRADADRFGLLVRDLIDAACRSAKPSSALRVTLERHGPEAELAVVYEPLPAEERRIDVFGAYDEVGIDRLVVDAIVSAHSWTLSEKHVAGSTTLSVRLPLFEEANDEDGTSHSDR